MLAYCNWLLVNGVFHDVQISFLPVGHTHKDIDQMFSTFIIGMHHEPLVPLIAHFVSNISKWYTKPCMHPEVIFL